MGNQEFLFQPGIYFWLRVFLILVENVPNFFFKGKKKYFCLGTPWPEHGAAIVDIMSFDYSVFTVLMNKYHVLPVLFIKL